MRYEAQNRDNSVLTNKTKKKKNVENCLPNYYVVQPGHERSDVFDIVTCLCQRFRPLTCCLSASHMKAIYTRKISLF